MLFIGKPMGRSIMISMSCIHSLSCIYLYMCVYLVRVNLDIILLVVSDSDASAKGWKSLFQNAGVFEVHELHEFLVHSQPRFPPRIV